MKEKMNKIPVFYACDDNFVKYTMVSLQSMMDHASKEAQYEIHVLHTNISEEMQKEDACYGECEFFLCSLIM